MKSLLLAPLPPTPLQRKVLLVTLSTIHPHIVMVYATWKVVKQDKTGLGWATKVQVGGFSCETT